MTETEIKNKIRKQLSAWVVLFNSPTAEATLDSGVRAKMGFHSGASDLIGIRRCDGKFVALEVKTPEGLIVHFAALNRARSKLGKNLTKTEKHAFEQDAFILLINRNNGIGAFVTSVEEAMEHVR